MRSRLYSVPLHDCFAGCARHANPPAGSFAIVALNWAEVSSHSLVLNGLAVHS